MSFHKQIIMIENCIVLIGCEIESWPLFSKQLMSLESGGFCEANKTKSQSIYWWIDELVLFYPGWKYQNLKWKRNQKDWQKSNLLKLNILCYV